MLVTKAGNEGLQSHRIMFLPTINAGTTVITAW